MASSVERSVMLPPERAEAGARVNAQGLHIFALLVGSALALIGLSSVAALWWDPQFGTAQWELVAITRTLDVLPLFTLSLLLLGVGALLSGSVRATRLVAVLLGGMALLVIVMAVLYAMSTAVVWKTAQGAPAEALTMFKRVGAKAAIDSAVYTALYAALGVMLWRRTRRRT